MTKKLQYLRKMTEADLDAVIKVEKKAYPFPWSRKIFEDCLEKQSYSCWLFEQNEECCGYLISSAAVGEAHILNLCVHPKLQGQGWGRKLLAEAEWIARQLRAETCFLEVRPSNIAAYALYESNGFNKIGVRRKYYPAEQGREDAVIMAKVLL